MSHYSLAQKPKQLLKWAESIAIDVYLKKVKYPILVYRGMSGISAATALSLQLHIIGVKHGMIYVRKENEDSHGKSIEVEWDLPDEYSLIFVDDFVVSGETRQTCEDAISHLFFDTIHWSHQALQMDYNDTEVFKLIKL